MSELKNLMPEWNVSGKEENVFFDELNSLEDRTIFIKKRLSSCAWFSIIPEENFEKENVNPVSLNRRKIEEGCDVWAGKAFTCFDTTRNNNLAVPMNYVFKFGEDEEKRKIKNEIENVGGMMSFDIDGNPTLIPLSSWGFKDLSDRTGTSCKKTGVKSQNRDRWMVENFSSGFVTFVVRKAEDENDNSKCFYKAFAVRGQIYEGQSQQQLIEATKQVLEEDLGEGNSIHWNVSNEGSEIAFTFPKKQKEIKDFYPTIPDDCIPIVKIKTSDIGNCSFVVSAGFNINGFDLLTKNGTVSVVHDKNLTPKNIAEEVKKSLYQEFIAIPDNLARLLGIDVSNVAVAIDDVLDFIGIEKKQGLRSVGKAIKEEMISEMAMGIDYTAYDVVVNLMSIPSRLVLTKKSTGETRVLPESTRRALEECLSQAIYCPFETLTTNINFV